MLGCGGREPVPEAGDARRVMATRCFRQRVSATGRGRQANLAPHNLTAGLVRCISAGSSGPGAGMCTDRTGPACQGGVPVTWFRQMAASRLGLAMFVVVLAAFGSLMGAGFAAAQAHAVHQA